MGERVSGEKLLLVAIRPDVDAAVKSSQILDMSLWSSGSTLEPATGHGGQGHADVRRKRKRGTQRGSGWWTPAAPHPSEG